MAIARTALYSNRVPAKQGTIGTESSNSEEDKSTKGRSMTPPHAPTIDTRNSTAVLNKLQSWTRTQLHIHIQHVCPRKRRSYQLSRQAKGIFQETVLVDEKGRHTTNRDDMSKTPGHKERAFSPRSRSDGSRGTIEVSYRQPVFQLRRSKSLENGQPIDQNSACPSDAFASTALRIAHSSWLSSVGRERLWRSFVASQKRQVGR